MPEPLELCLASPRYYPVYGGPGERFRRYAPGLRARGVNMRVFAGFVPDAGQAGENGDRPPMGQVMPAEDIEGTSVHRVRLPYQEGRPRTVSTYTKALARFCRDNRTRPDVVQLLTITPWSLRGLLQLKRQGVPTVYTRTMVPNPSVARFRQMIWSMPWRLVDSIVVSSGVMRESMRELGFRGRIEVIPNGVNLERFRPLPDPGQRRQLRERLGLPLDGELILFMGGVICPRKGIDLLLKAWHRISKTRPRAYLVMVGPHQAGVRNDPEQAAFIRGVEESIENSPAPDRVVVTGKVDNVQEYFQVADVNVFPSRREGMPNVVPEAFACALPSVLTPFVGLPTEFGRPGEQYILVDHDSDAIADSVISLLADRARREELGREAHRWVTEHLGLDRSLDNYTDLYSELARRGKKRAGTGNHASRI